MVPSVERTNMNALVLLATIEDGGKVEEIARTFGVDWSHLIAQIISFSIVCFLLHRFAYKPVLKIWRSGGSKSRGADSTAKRSPLS